MLPADQFPPDPHEHEVEEVATFLCKRAFRDVRDKTGIVPLEVEIRIGYPREDLGDNVEHNIVIRMTVDSGFEDAYMDYVKKRIKKDAENLINGIDSDSDDGDDLP